ncbi:NAD(P)/FAD-dependent oxidoreductase [Microbacterium dextranolyticum]|uniref:Thioredoxin reductase n=1 Tax=Microbacterium dextranolyticum TaxID=36806 RepID=A0A9W6HJR7_9MICO|nr:NAD(P)/FAD-dependent oxidoreductase [Microbacterium dextranolyticum]MBM7461798.1 thioredoxin reductase [Microbacterium dextranolyticum]GLJ94039.1 thioredoxin reductase [Microbacterium dextranolyticum]
MTASDGGRTPADEAPPTEASVDAVVIGGGPAGLSAALNLARARATVVVIDAGRPRNAATLRSHGFLTRDGIPPIELRKLAHAELAAYPNVRILERTLAESIVPADGDGGIRFEVALTGRGAVQLPVVHARSVVVATGLRETLPDIADLRSFYGMSLFSCAACDAWELQGRPLALIGESDDLADRARLIARWTDRLTVFTHGSTAVDAADEAELAALGIAVDRRRITALRGERGAVAEVALEGGDAVPIDGGFVRPEWEPALDLLRGVAVERNAAGHLATDRAGRTSVPGLYSAGDAASGPQQLIVAAGQGARVAAVLVHDLVGVTTSH